MEFIPVQSFSNYVEAHIAMGNLQQQDINCWLKDEYTVTIDPLLTNAIGGIKLMVAKVQVPRALEILSGAAAGKKQHYGCPHCGSHDIHWVEAPQKKVNLFTALFNRLLGKDAASAQSWQCFACGQSFKQPIQTNAAAMEESR